MAGEQELIARVWGALPCRARRLGGELRLGVGDDAAVLRPGRGREWVVSSDFFLEKVHFRSETHPPEAVGYRALARAVSDLAAMGATPSYFLLGLALPTSRCRTWLDRFLRGMARAARKFGMVLIGGDTSSHASVAIHLTVFGHVAPSRARLRCGARPGDPVFVSGTLGRAQLGLELILRGLHRQRRWRALLQAHLFPEPRLALGQMLARTGLASAMIDTSDGLSTDLAHICVASGVGALLRPHRLPVVRVPEPLARRGLEATRLALHGGEDYELLFSVPQRRRHHVPQSFRGVALTEIGFISKEKGICLEDSRGRMRKLEPGGWDPFRK